MQKPLEVKELVKELGITRQRISILLQMGRFPGAYKHGKSWAIPRAAVDKYIAGKAKKEVE